MILSNLIDHIETIQPSIVQWIDEMETLCQPEDVIWHDGSAKMQASLIQQAVSQGILIPLNQGKMPNCYLHRSNPNDVARTEHLTFICAPIKQEVGPTNNWMDPTSAKDKLTSLSQGGMRHRTMYVIPYTMGPTNSPYCRHGVEITDSIYVAISMHVMTRVGSFDGTFVKGLHLTLDCDPERRYVCHFPQDNLIWSVGSAYGGNALLGKKCHALRIASYQGHQEGWLAEHMLILGVESPEGETTYVAAAFPSACGKTNFAMMIPPDRFQGWKIWTVGDDIAWMHIKNGRLYAINPENGYFGVAPGTNKHTNPNAMETVSHDTIFTNVALTQSGDVWWEGKNNDDLFENVTDWQGNPWKGNWDSTTKAAHPNSRFTAPATNNPALSKFWDDPNGVPISAIIFGGRRATTVPLVMQSFNWLNGVFFGATMGSETTAAATGQTGIVRRDPFAMLPFCGYDMGTYFAHWLSMKAKLDNPPKMFLVNWFRKDANGDFLWPGYGDNMRVLQWIVNRARLRVSGQETPFGWVPKAGDLDLSGMTISKERVDAATHIDLAEWKTELQDIEAHFNKLGDTVPKLLKLHLETLREQITLMENDHES
jgi:phosphoenolpyruvate carboxykinase (GTP)